MTDLMNDLKNIASDSTVKTVAATLAVGGFLLNAVFGIGQTSFGLALQGLTAAAILGMTAANATKRRQEAQQDEQPNDFYNPIQEEEPVKQSSELVQQLISRFFPVTTSCGTPSRVRKEKSEEESKPTLVQTLITSFVKPVITSCGNARTSAKKRRNADDDMMDMAYGRGTRAGWTAWAKR